MRTTVAYSDYDLRVENLGDHIVRFTVSGTLSVDDALALQHRTAKLRPQAYCRLWDVREMAFEPDPELPAVVGFNVLQETLSRCIAIVGSVPEVAEVTEHHRSMSPNRNVRHFFDFEEAYDWLRGCAGERACATSHG